MPRLSTVVSCILLTKNCIAVVSWDVREIDWDKDLTRQSASCVFCQRFRLALECLVSSVVLDYC